MDIGFICTCIIMLPRLALFYGGLVQRKNVLSSMMHSVAMGIMAVG